MDPLIDLQAVVTRQFFELSLQRFADLRFDRFSASVATLLILAALAALGLVMTTFRRPTPPDAVTIPALPPGLVELPSARLRHAPLLLFFAGLSFFIIALGDPVRVLTEATVTRPGRRIALMIDASSSMNAPFAARQLDTRGDATFFTTVAAAEYFLRLRMKGPYRDLVSLIEFGNEAYVVTPFTSDYDNLLLSMRLIAEPGEWERFPDQGTFLIKAISQGAELFKAFDFLNASGNLMVIFTDGEDSQVKLSGRSIDEILAEARKYGIPVSMIRTSFNKGLGGVLPDEIWKSAIERTGGRFYAAADETTIIRAVDEIDRMAPGRIVTKRYTAREPRFGGFALVAVACWTLASTLPLTTSFFRTFP